MRDVHNSPFCRRLQEVLAGLALWSGLLLVLPGSLQAQLVTFDENVSPQVFELFCIACHSSSLTTLADRQDAPLNVDYDTFERATQGTNESRAVARVMAGTMPPASAGGELSQELKELMQAWQNSGFPETTPPLPPELMAVADVVDADGGVPARSRVSLDGTNSSGAADFIWVQMNCPPVIPANPVCIIPISPNECEVVDEPMEDIGDCETGVQPVNGVCVEENEGCDAPSFFAPDVDADTQLTFQLTVTAADGEQATDTAEVIVLKATPSFADDTGDGINGGCTINPDASFNPVMVSLAGFMLVFLGWRRVKLRPRKWFRALHEQRSSEKEGNSDVS